MEGTFTIEGLASAFEELKDSIDTSRAEVLTEIDSLMEKLDFIQALVELEEEEQDDGEEEPPQVEDIWATPATAARTVDTNQYRSWWEAAQSMGGPVLSVSDNVKGEESDHDKPRIVLFPTSKVDELEGSNKARHLDNRVPIWIAGQTCPDELGKVLNGRLVCRNSNTIVEGLRVYAKHPLTGGSSSSNDCIRIQGRPTETIKNLFFNRLTLAGSSDEIFSVDGAGGLISNVALRKSLLFGALGADKDSYRSFKFHEPNHQFGVYVLDGCLSFLMDECEVAGIRRRGMAVEAGSHAFARNNTFISIDPKQAYVKDGPVHFNPRYTLPVGHPYTTSIRVEGNDTLSWVGSGDPHYLFTIGKTKEEYVQRNAEAGFPPVAYYEEGNPMTTTPLTEDFVQASHPPINWSPKVGSSGLEDPLYATTNPPQGLVVKGATSLPAIPEKPLLVRDILAMVPDNWDQPGPQGIPKIVSFLHEMLENK